MKRKISVSLLSVGLLIVPASIAWAAFDDVTLTTDTILSVNSINISVSSASAVLEQIIVDSTTFDVTLLSGSSITVRSGDRKVMTHNSPSQYVVSDLCASTYSELKFSKNDSGSVTITVTPSNDTCGQAASVAQVGGSSGGGGGIVLSTVSGQPLAAPQYATTSTAAPTQTQAPITAPQVPTSVSAVFSRNLSLGSSGEDVMRLQELLNSDFSTQVAASGVGSPGNETTYFGSLTQSAVQRFQAKYGVVSAGTPATTGYGLVGPKTRAKLLEVFGSAAPPLINPPASVSTSGLNFTKPLYLGLSDTYVKNLQIILNRDPETQVAASGVGSAGNETNYFGALTEAAVKKFQVKYGIAVAGDPGYGLVGPKTRAKLNELATVWQ